MIKNCVIVIRPAELFLKKGNRREFEQQLIKNLLFLLESQNVLKVLIVNSVFLIMPHKLLNLETAREKISQYLIGCANVSTGWIVERNKEELLKAVDELLERRNLDMPRKQTFRVTVHRHHKMGFYTTLELQRLVGTVITSTSSYTVNLTNYDFEVRIEVFRTCVIVCDKTVNGLGGLPVPTSGCALHLLSAGFDSPVSSYLLHGRGMHADYIHFDSGNAADKQAIQKVRAQIINLKKYQQRETVKLFVVNIELLFNEIVCSAPNQYRLLILKYFFIYISNVVRKAHCYDAISTGESLGQVSSQTISNLNFLYRNYDGFPLTPLIGMNKNQIIKIAKKIGSHEITLKPGDDLCKNFVGKHQTPRIRKPDEFKKALNNPIYTKIVEEIIKKHVYEHKI